MNNVDYLLEQHYKNVAARPQRKYEETITTFDRNIFWYDKDEVVRQRKAEATTAKVTYEDHRKAIETAVNMMRQESQHDIALCILTHRHFSDYRAKVFGGDGSFTADYSFIIRKVNMIFNPNTSRVSTTSIHSRLAEYTEPTLVQVNYISGIVKTINTPESELTLNEWAIKFNTNANESTKYMVAGLKIGA